MFRIVSFLALCLFLPGLAAPASAQDLSSCRMYEAVAMDIQHLEHTSHFYGSPQQAVRIDCDEMQFFADYMEILRQQDLITAEGHIVFVSGGNRISADRMEFNTKTRTGTFYNARGIATIGDRVERSMFGSQEPDAYFWGAELKKLGPTKYRILRGGFTTCVQPTPRWEVSSGSYSG
jgi:lipopolysaccharide assembly outer membrane protein LptD (OstA)